MKPLSPYAAMPLVIDTAYTKMTDREQPWPRDLVMVVLTMADQLTDKENRYVALAVNALLTLPVDIREQLIAEYAIPRLILDQLDNPPAWPTPVPVEGFSDVLSVDLEVSRSLALSRVQYKSDQVRKRHITPITGQIGIYREFANEAAAFLTADPEPTDMTPYPHLERLSPVYNNTYREMAEEWLDQHRGLSVISSALEEARQGANLVINAAETVEEIHAAEATFNAAVSQL